MSPAHVFEPTYRSLRERLLTGIWPPGTRLESARLAATLAVSATPVRDSLNRLVGEGLVSLQPGLGFLVPRPLEQDLRDLLACQHQLLLLALQDSLPASSEDRHVGAQVAKPTSLVSRRRALFAALSQAGRNRVLADLAQQIDDRLAPILHAETDVLENVAGELESLEAAWAQARQATRPRKPMAPLLHTYFERRSGAASALLIRLNG